MLTYVSRPPWRLVPQAGGLEGPPIPTSYSSLSMQIERCGSRCRRGHCTGIYAKGDPHVGENARSWYGSSIANVGSSSPPDTTMTERETVRCQTLWDVIGMALSPLRNWRGVEKSRPLVFLLRKTIMPPWLPWNCETFLRALMPGRV